MKITSARYIKGITGSDSILTYKEPQIAFIGRSNVGKSSLINALTHEKKLAITSSYPGRTQILHIFMINNKYMFVDLPGYGFAAVDKRKAEKMDKLIAWYLLVSGYPQKVVLILDAVRGLTEKDAYMIKDLHDAKRHIFIIVNKIDKLKRTELDRQLATIQGLIGNADIFPVSTKTGEGIAALTNALLEGL